MRFARAAQGVCLALVAFSSGCGDDETGTGDEGAQTTGTVTPPPVKPVVIDLVVDANRDGAIDPADPTEQERENEWDAEVGASYLANLDDDNLDKIIDAEDEVIDIDPATCKQPAPGAACPDLDDLARIVVSAWPDAPDGAVGVFSIDEPSAQNVRIFKLNPDGYYGLVAGSLGPCNAPGAPCQIVPVVNFTADEVRSGVELRIEGLRFRTSDDEGTWNGMTQLAYSVVDTVLTNQGIPAADAMFGAEHELCTSGAYDCSAAPEGLDEAKIRLAPWMLFGNLSGFDTVWSNTVSTPFVKGLEAPILEAGLTYAKITATMWGSDHWTQDYFQTGWTSMPSRGPQGEPAVQGMRIGNARPWGRTENDKDLPIEFLRKNFLGPDRGILAVYAKAHSGTSYDSHGNHDLIPAYENGADAFPIGRIVYGATPLPETREFYSAQQVQGPPLVVDTSWLIVGHVDEVFSYVPADTPRGWKLLVGSPKLARTMLEQAQADGFGSVEMFVGKYWWNGAAAISIDEVLADADIMAWSQQSQVEIDSMLADYVAAIGLAPDEIVEMPYLFERDSGAMVAYNPGTANLLAFGDYVVIADPFGPKLDGIDLFKKDLQERLGTPVNQLGSTGEGLFVFFADDWDSYHRNLGEVHCGSNADGVPPASERWWEVGR